MFSKAGQGIPGMLFHVWMSIIWHLSSGVICKLQSTLRQRGSVCAWMPSAMLWLGFLWAGYGRWPARILCTGL